ncbi:Non-specific lipid-transfer protein 13 [Spatholobus suberectus]|nr:Non-specific lipid-transfer protein 13 [Spatholobus suberectus]
MARLLAFLTLFLLIYRSEMSPTSSISGDQVYWDFVTCLRFLAGYESDPTKHCCETAVSKLNMEAKQYTQAICQCIENLAKGVGIQFDVSRIEALPVKCHTPIIFPISDSINSSE